jgi:hypothetical protein
MRVVAGGICLGGNPIRRSPFTVRRSRFAENLSPEDLKGLKERILKSRFVLFA